MGLTEWNLSRHHFEQFRTAARPDSGNVKKLEGKKQQHQYGRNCQEHCGGPPRPGRPHQLVIRSGTSDRVASMPVCTIELALQGARGWQSRLQRAGKALWLVHVS